MNAVVSRTTVTAVVAVALAAPLALATPAFAHGRGGGTAVRSFGHCSGGGAFDLKAKHDDGRIEVEYEVDSDRAGQTWHVRLRDNSVTVVSRAATTAAPSGSFTIHRSLANRAGSDTIRARATFRMHTCGGVVTL